MTRLYDFTKFAKDARAFPSYTLAELKARVEGVTDPATRQKMLDEIVAREAGTSKPRVTPQIEGGKITPKVGRL